jgi:hypothetical protein
MQIAAEALKMRREQRGIGIIYLLGGVSPASGGSSDHCMRIHDFIERAVALTPPFYQ